MNPFDVLTNVQADHLTYVRTFQRSLLCGGRMSSGSGSQISVEVSDEADPVPTH